MSSEIIPVPPLPQVPERYDPQHMRNFQRQVTDFMHGASRPGVGLDSRIIPLEARAKVEAGVVDALHPDFSAATSEAQIQQAIDYAETNDHDFVLVSEGLISSGYDASLVDFTGSGGTWAGRMVRAGQRADVYDVRAYGAAGDGATDDTAAIQAAIDRAEPGSVVYCPSGHFAISMPLSIPSGVSVHGASMLQSQIRPMDSDAHGIHVQPDADQVELRNLRVFYEVAGAGSALKFGDNCNNVIVESVWAQNCQYGFESNNMWMSRFSNCRAEDTVRGFRMLGKTEGGVGAGTTLVLMNCYANRAAQAGFELTTRRTCVLIACACDNLQGPDFGAIWCPGSSDISNVTVIQFNAENNALTDDRGIFYIQGNSRVQVIGGQVQGTTVVGGGAAAHFRLDSTDGDIHLSVNGLWSDTSGANVSRLITSGPGVCACDFVGLSLSTTAASFLGSATSRIHEVGYDGKVGWFNATPVARPDVTGSRGGNAALASLLTQLQALGLVTDSTV